MVKIIEQKFTNKVAGALGDVRLGLDWPVVYIIEDGKRAYVGETVNAKARMKRHLRDGEKSRLSRFHLISDDDLNKSATLELESLLLEYMSADGHFKLLNGTGGTRHNFFDRERYLSKFETVWEELRRRSLVVNSLSDIENRDLFKYSPFKALTAEQFSIAEEIVSDMKTYTAINQIVTGEPGTGKTVLAVYLFKKLIEEKVVNSDMIALVVPMTSLRKTLKKVFRSVSGLKSSMVIGPNDVAKKTYDIIMVDEAHRLQRRRSISHFGAFDRINRQFGFDDNGTQLDWIQASAQRVLLFYDAGQSVRPADIRPEFFESLERAKRYKLTSQLRVEGGPGYTNLVRDFFSQSVKTSYDIGSYDLQLFDNLKEMVGTVKEKDGKHSLSRLVAGYCWKWESKFDRELYDITIDDVSLRWNSTNSDWINSQHADEEVGCIHTVQGYDLNYCGVIIGPDIKYDKKEKRIFIDREQYYDRNGRAGIENEAELERYIKNIYSVLMTRGIKGTYVYIVDEPLRELFREVLKMTSQNRC